MTHNEPKSHFRCTSMVTSCWFEALSSGEVFDSQQLQAKYTVLKVIDRHENKTSWFSDIL